MQKFKFFINLIICFFSLNIFCQTNMKKEDIFYDLSNSHLTWLTPENSYGRWDINSITYIYDKSYKIIDRLIGVGPMMAAKVYGNTHLFYEPPFEYMAVFGLKKYKIFRTHYPTKNKDNHGLIYERFKELNVDLINLDNRKLEIIKEKNNIIDFLHNYNDLYAEISIKRYNYVIRFFCKINHINFDNKNRFQVETGPLVIPNFLYDKNLFDINFTSFAYVAFNNFQSVNFLIHETEKNSKFRYYNKSVTLDAEINLLIIK